MPIRSTLLSAALFALCTVSISVWAQGSAPARSFIVVLTDQAGPPEWVAEQIAIKHGGRVGFIYDRVLNGFSITLPLAAVRGVANRPDVAYVERDLPMSIIAQDMPTGIERIFAADNANLDIDGTDDFRVDADVAVLDTGIDLEHPDLNVVGGANCLQSTGGGPPWARSFYCDAAVSADDDHYHGTHVAGTIGAIDNGSGVVGVAPGVRLWAVKVLDSSGSGYASGIIAAMDWVSANGGIEVINMSLSGPGISTAYQTAIDNTVAAGVVVVVAAGNNDADAGGYSPAYVPSAITVSALADFDGVAGEGGSPGCLMDQDDTLADFSNWGTVIDIAAPGVCILSTLPLEQGEYGILNGTSMAAPHVAGTAAILASGAGAPSNGTDVQAIRDVLVGQGNFGWIDDSGDGTQEPLLDLSNSGVFFPAVVAGEEDAGGSPPTGSPPIASFSYSCTDLDCIFDGSGSSDADGSISGYSWNFNGPTGSGVTASHSFTNSGTYEVTLTVTDNDGMTDSDSREILVSASAGGGITLSATGYKVKGWHKVDLSWNNGVISADNVDVHRNETTPSAFSFTTDNVGSYTDEPNQKGGGSYSYRVCEAGTSICSAEVNVTF
jgi:subtilisin